MGGMKHKKSLKIPDYRKYRKKTGEMYETYRLKMD